MPTRPTAIAVVLGFLVGPVHGDELAESKTAYAESVAVAREELLESFTDAVKTAAEAGELVSVAELLEQKQAFEESGKLPTNRFIKEAVEAYSEAESKARTRVVEEYETTLSKLTNSAKLEEARKVGEELEAIKAGGEVSVTSSTPAVKPKPSDPVLAELQEAKEKYEADYGELAEQLLSEIDERILELSKAGKLDAIGVVQKSREEFASSGKISDSEDDDVKFAKAKFDRALVRHARAMTASYRKAIGRYRRVKNVEGVEKLEAELAAWTADAGRPTGGARVVNLLRLVLERRGTRRVGKWAVREDAIALVQGSFVPKFVFPYEPPEEYDFSMEFIQPRLRHDVGMIMPDGTGNAFYWAVGGTDGLFLLYTEATPRPFVNRVKGAFRPNVKYRTRVQVRENEVRTYVNGKLIYAYKGDIGALGVDHWRKLERKSQLAIFADDPTVFTKIMVKEISGPGKIVPLTKP